MGFLGNTYSFLKDIGKKAKKVKTVIAEALFKPAVKAVAAPVAALSEGVSGLRGKEQGGIGSRLSKFVFGGTKAGTSERAGESLKLAGEAASFIPVGRGATIAATMLKRGIQGAGIGGAVSGGSVAAASGTGRETLEGIKRGAIFGGALSISLEGVSALMSTKWAKDRANNLYVKGLNPDKNILDNEAQLQYRNSLERFSEKVQNTYGANSLNGYIKKSDGDIVKWGKAYRNQLDTVYPDAVIFGDEIIGESLDTFQKNIGKGLTKNQDKLLLSTLDDFNIKQMNSPSKVLDARQAVANEIPTSVRNSLRRGEPISDKFEVLLSVERALNDTLSKLNPADAILTQANKKMSFAYNVRNTAAAQQVALQRGKSPNTADAMSAIDRLLASTLLSTPVRTGIAGGIFNASALPQIGTQGNMLIQQFNRMKTPQAQKRTPEQLGQLGFTPDSQQLSGGPSGEELQQLLGDIGFVAE